MGKADDGRREYVVEVEVAGVAIVTVQASSSDEACTLAEERARPVDVAELDTAEAKRVVRVGSVEETVARVERRVALQTRAKGRERGRQA